MRCKNPECLSMENGLPKTTKHPRGPGWEKHQLCRKCWENHQNQMDNLPRNLSS